MIMTKLTVADIADEMLEAFDLDDALGGLAMAQLHNRVKAQETDPEVATKMLNEGFLAALRRSNEKELREFARMKFESFSVAGRRPN
jgi:phage-related baseplate assembly protein